MADDIRTSEFRGQLAGSDPAGFEELLSGEIFHTLQEAKILIEPWGVHYNTERPHSGLGNMPLAPEATLPVSPIGLAPLPNSGAQGIHILACALIKSLATNWGGKSGGS